MGRVRCSISFPYPLVREVRSCKNHLPLLEVLSMREGPD